MQFKNINEDRILALIKDPKSPIGGYVAINKNVSIAFYNSETKRVSRKFKRALDAMIWLANMRKREVPKITIQY